MPELRENFLDVLREHTAGDPQREEVRWTNLTKTDLVAHLAKTTTPVSVRDIERLARGYFQGPASLREAIDSGKLGWSLEQIKHVPEDQEGCNEFERRLLEDLQIVVKYMQRVTMKCQDPRLKNRSFYAQANLLTGSLLTKANLFAKG